MKKAVIGSVIVFICSAVIIFIIFPPKADTMKGKLSITLPHFTLYHAFDEYYRAVRRKAGNLPVRDECTARLVRNHDSREGTAILYVHTYGACRSDGDAVIDRIASQLNANVYYLRLPGHGIEGGDYTAATLEEHLAAVRDALIMMDRLGDRVFLIGNGYGGLLATYISAFFPHRLSGTILVSPVYEIADPARAFLLNSPRLYSLLQSFPALRRLYHRLTHTPGRYETSYMYESQFMRDAMRRILRPGILYNVMSPVCLIYYYRNRDNQDRVASVRSMRRVFRKFPNTYNREIQIPRGHHQLLSPKHTEDSEMVEREILRFITMILEDAPEPEIDTRGYNIGM